MGYFYSSRFSLLSDDLLMTIFSHLESDPRDWARLSCVCSRFCDLIGNVCCKETCSLLLPFSGEPSGGWAAIRKLSSCCPGLSHAGILLETSDFGLQLDIGPDEQRPTITPPPQPPPPVDVVDDSPEENLGWTMFDDLYHDTIYDTSECNTFQTFIPAEENTTVSTISVPPAGKEPSGREAAVHVSCAWAPSREQGRKLLAARFKEDRLYVSEWPGCVHVEERREYMLFRGVFGGDFKKSGVWRTIVDGGRKGSGLGCAFCRCKDTWDLHSSFCLRRAFGYHEDGQPVVRAYVCDNGHVSGAWTVF